MALQTSGAITLDQIHIEVGGSSGSSATINDADIRALIGKSDGATAAFNEWYGASSVGYWAHAYAKGVIDDTGDEYPNSYQSMRYAMGALWYDSTNNYLYAAAIGAASSSTDQRSGVFFKINLDDGQINMHKGVDHAGGGVRVNGAFSFHGNNIVAVSSTKVIISGDTYNINTISGQARTALTTPFTLNHSNNTVSTANNSQAHFLFTYPSTGALLNMGGGDRDYGGINYFGGYVWYFGQHGTGVSGTDIANNGFISSSDTSLGSLVTRNYRTSNNGGACIFHKVIENGSGGFAMCASGGFIGTGSQSSGTPGNITFKQYDVFTEIIDIARDGSGNFYASGYISGSHGFIAKFNSSCDVQWARKIAVTSGHYMKLGSIAVQAGGDIIVAGVETNFEATAQGMQVLSFNSSGTIQWQKQIYYSINNSSTKQARLSWLHNQGTWYQKSCMCLGPSDSIILSYRHAVVSLHGDGSTANTSSANWSIQGSSRTISTISTSADVSGTLLAKTELSFTAQGGLGTPNASGSSYTEEADESLALSD